MLVLLGLVASALFPGVDTRSKRFFISSFSSKCVYSVKPLPRCCLFVCLYSIRPSVTGLSHPIFFFLLFVFCSPAFHIPTGAKLVRHAYSLVLQKLFCFCEDIVSWHVAQYCHTIRGRFSDWKSNKTGAVLIVDLQNRSLIGVIWGRIITGQF